MTFADKLTLLRIVLVPVFLSLLSYSKANPVLLYWALAVFILAVLTDFFDGLVARIKNEKSELGAALDPFADKLLMISAFVSLYLLKFAIPLWAVLIMVSRDLLILFGTFFLYFLKIEVKIIPTAWGKLTTALQMAAAIAVILDLYLSFWIICSAVFFTLISGFDYLRKGVRIVNVAEAENSG